MGPRLSDTEVCTNRGLKSIPMRILATIFLVCTFLNIFDAVSKAEDDGRPVDVCVHSTQRIRLKPLLESGLANVSYHDYCSIPFMHVKKKMGNTFLLAMQIDLNNGCPNYRSRFDNLRRIVDVNISFIYVMVRLQDGPSGTYMTIVNEHNSSAFHLDNHSFKEFRLRRSFHLNDSFELRFLAEDGTYVEIDTWNSYTLTCIRLVFSSQILFS